MGKPSVRLWFTILLFVAATFCFLATTITAPVTHNLSMLTVTLKNGTHTKPSALSFGTLGYCVLDAAGPVARPSKAQKPPPASKPRDYCTRPSIGYQAATLTSRAIPGVKFTAASVKTIDSLTYLMALHPVACLSTFFTSLFVGLHSFGYIGPRLAARGAMSTWVVVGCIGVIDLSMWGAVRDHVHKHAKGQHPTGPKTGSTPVLPEGKFGNGMWVLVAGWMLLSVGTGLVVQDWRKARKVTGGGGGPKP